MFLTLAVRAAGRGWHRIASVMLELDLLLAGLGGASRRIRAERKQRQRHPRTSALSRFSGRA